MTFFHQVREERMHPNQIGLLDSNNYLFRLKPKVRYEPRRSLIHDHSPTAVSTAVVNQCGQMVFPAV